MWYWVTFLSDLPVVSEDTQWVWSVEPRDGRWRCHALVVSPSSSAVAGVLSKAHQVHEILSVAPHPKLAPDYGGKVGRRIGWVTPPRYWVRFL